MSEDQNAFQERLARIETLLETIQAAPNPALRTSAEELVQTLLDLHGAGLKRLLEIVWEAGETGARVIQEELPDDELISSLLLLHGLHPLSVEARVQQALEKVRPYMQSHGGNVEVLGIEDGVVKLRLQGSCESCPASAMTLKYAVEDAIYEAAPDVLAIETAGAEEEPSDPSFIPLEQMSANGALTPDQARWHEIGGLAALAPRTVHTEEVAGRSVLFCRLGDNVYAYGNACPACHQPLGAASIEGTTLTCPHCAQPYDVIRAGRGLDRPDLYLDPVPLLVEKGTIKIALPETAA